jgi:hypothetical protein
LQQRWRADAGLKGDRLASTADGFCAAFIVAATRE